jgi:PPE-repeat protein
MTIDFGMFPPEINSDRMDAGPGSGPMLVAAAAWDDLAAELRATAASYWSVISGLTVGWRGPASATMATAAAPYVAWISATAERADQTAGQARAAAAAYKTASAATVPPAVVAANRVQSLALFATNFFGQSTATIMATQTDDIEMWARDVAAMSTYAAQSAAATRVTPFAVPASTTNPGGLLGQLLQALQTLATSVGSSAQTQFSQLFAAVPTALQSLGTIITGPNPASGLLTSNDVLINTVMGLVVGTKWLDGLAPEGAATAAGGAKSVLAAGLGSGPHLVGSARLGQTVSADVGRAGLVGGMSVPPSWATALPAIRTVAFVLPGAAQNAVRAAAVGEGTLLSGMALAGMAGSAVGAAAPPLSAVRARAFHLTQRRLAQRLRIASEPPASCRRHGREPRERAALAHRFGAAGGPHRDAEEKTGHPRGALNRRRSEYDATPHQLEAIKTSDSQPAEAFSGGHEKTVVRF